MQIGVNELEARGPLGPPSLAEVKAGVAPWSLSQPCLEEGPVPGAGNLQGDDGLSSGCSWPSGFTLKLIEQGHWEAWVQGLLCPP